MAEWPLRVGLSGRRPGPIAHYTGAAAAGGKLLLTNRSLCFSAHGFNVGRAETVIMLKDITNVKLAANLLITQHILVSTAARKHKFAVYHGKEWVAKIQEARKNISDDHATDGDPNDITEITVKCQSCGGVNTIRKGAAAECVFCGSLIKGA